MCFSRTQGLFGLQDFEIMGIGKVEDWDVMGIPILRNFPWGLTYCVEFFGIRSILDQSLGIYDLNSCETNPKDRKNS